MRTARALTVSAASMLCTGGVCLLQGGCLVWGLPGPVGCLLLGGGGVSAPGGVTGISFKMS